MSEDIGLLGDYAMVLALSGADAIRIIEAITVGVSFLAAGTIIHSGRDVRGLTTGAGMWLAGAGGIGMRTRALCARGVRRDHGKQAKLAPPAPRRPLGFPGR
jgi:hypothetical protein